MKRSVSLRRLRYYASTCIKDDEVASTPGKTVRVDDIVNLRTPNVIPDFRFLVVTARMLIVRADGHHRLAAFE